MISGSSTDVKFLCIAVGSFTCFLASLTTQTLNTAVASIPATLQIASVFVVGDCTTLRVSIASHHSSNSW